MSTKGSDDLPVAEFDSGVFPLFVDSFSNFLVDSPADSSAGLPASGSVVDSSGGGAEASKSGSGARVGSSSGAN